MHEIEPEIKALQDSIFLTKVARARREPISERLATGPLLFDQGVLVMRGVIRAEHPEYSDLQVAAEVRRRLKIRRHLDEAGLYRDAGTLDELDE